MQPDPLDTGLLLTHLNRLTQALAPALAPFTLAGLYGDGLNLYVYAAGNPVNRVDPLGLDSQDDVDEAIYGCYAERAAYADAMMGTAQRGFNAALFIGQLALSMMPGGEAVILAGRLAQGADFGWDDFGYAPADLLNLGPVCRMASRFGERAT